MLNTPPLNHQVVVSSLQLMVQSDEVKLFLKQGNAEADRLMHIAGADSSHRALPGTGYFI